MNHQEDPAIVMARKTLFEGRRQVEEEEKMSRVMKTRCSECGNKVPMKGLRFDVVDGVRKYVCDECLGEARPAAVSAVAVVEGPRPARKSCFFCQADTFHIALDGSFQCSGCGSVFVKGRA